MNGLKNTDKRRNGIIFYKNATSNRFKDITGKKAGLLTVTSFAYIKNQESYWNCTCDCGQSKIIVRTSIGRTRSCGCLRVLANKNTKTTHGLSQHPLFDTWNNMISRCYKPTAAKYQYYGGRGITVYQEWIDNPSVFINWAENNGWRKGLELDRKDAHDNYCPSNCRWITKTEQRRHKDSIKLSMDKAQTIRELRKKGMSYIHIAKQYNVSPMTISAVINNRVWV